MLDFYEGYLRKYVVVCCVCACVRACIYEDFKYRVIQNALTISFVYCTEAIVCKKK